MAGKNYGNIFHFNFSQARPGYPLNTLATVKLNVGSPMTEGYPAVEVEEAQHLQEAPAAVQQLCENNLR